MYIFLEPFLLEEKFITYRNQDIPPGFLGGRIVFLTDIHHGPYFSKARLDKLVKRVNKLQPDIILLGGDYVHRNRNYIEPCFKALEKLEAPLGVYGVFGNHDYWAGAELTKRCMGEAGIYQLNNAAYWLKKNGDRIKVGGVGDYYEDIQDLEPTVADAKGDDFVVLVTHNPDYVEEMKTDKVDLVFAGHTHGGQITFFGLWAPILPSKYGQKYRTGVVDTAGLKVIVSNGIGTITPPVRFFARPQVIVVDLQEEIATQP